MLRWSVCLSLLLLPALAFAQAERYPARPIRLVNPYTPGGSVDIVARGVAQKLNEAWGQPVIVDNRPGAGTTIGTEIVVRAAPDGHTLLTTTGTIATNVTLYRNLSFDPVKNLAPVALVVQTPNVLAVHPSVPARSVREFIDLAKAKPGRVVYASSGQGSSTHLAMELFRLLAKIDLLHVPYKGGALAVTDLIGGQVQAIFNPVTAILPQARVGKLRALAVSSAKRVEIAPELPTVAESGLPGFEAIVWYPIFAPAGTPRRIVDQLNAELNRILQQSEARERFLNVGMIPVGGTPGALGEYLKAEIARWAQVIKAADIKLQ